MRTRSSRTMAMVAAVVLLTGCGAVEEGTGAKGESPASSSTSTVPSPSSSTTDAAAAEKAKEAAAKEARKAKEEAEREAAEKAAAEKAAAEAAAKEAADKEAAEKAAAEKAESTPPPTTPPTTPEPEPTPEVTSLRPGDSGPAVLELQQRLSALGYWLGAPDAHYGHLTTQAVMALQGSAGLGRDGIAGPNTMAALDRGVRPPVHGGPANRIEVDIARQVLLVVRGGGIQYILHTSTGSGERYRSSSGDWEVATTPPGSYSVFRSVDGYDEGPLGTLYRPRYFNGGIAVHGLGSVPGHPASHGCARVSNPAMDLIWAQDLMPIGSAVIVH